MNMSIFQRALSWTDEAFSVKIEDPIRLESKPCQDILEKIFDCLTQMNKVEKSLILMYPMGEY